MHPILDALPMLSLMEQTPIHPLPRLSQLLDGPELWIKRDDRSRLALGGNKTRKLQFLLAEAQAQGADTVVTLGAVQSNHCAQTAAACAMLGLDCHLLLRGQPDAPIEGNFLLDHWFGAAMQISADPKAQLPSLLDDLHAAGRRPYVIPYGGSNAVGLRGFLAAGLELQSQFDALDLSLDAVVVASSSGGTQAGLVLAQAAGVPWEVVGISADETAQDLTRIVRGLANAGVDALDLPLGTPPEPVCLDDYVGPGYGHADERTRRAIALLARHEGILLDPVYTGKAFAGLLDLVEQGRWRQGQRVLFWHTGGVAALFAYGSALLLEPA